MRTSRLVSAVAAFVFPFLAVACSSEPKPLQVTYYYNPGWVVCERVKPAVSGLEQEFPGRVEVALVSSEEEEAREDVKRLEFKNHGLVVRDFRGAVLIKQADHTFNLEEIRATLRQALGEGAAEDAEGAG